MSDEYWQEMTSEQFRAKKGQRKKVDKADLFAALWERHAPPDAPRPVREYQFMLPRKHAADFKFPRKVLVEIDGGQFEKFGGRHNTDSDRFKCNTACAMGYRVLHFSPQALVQDPLECIELVLRAIGYKERKS